MANELARIENEIRRVKNRLSELEIAARVLRDFAEGHPAASRKQTACANGQGARGKLEHETVAGAAKRALGELGGEGHFKEIAKEAMNHGFRSKGDLDSIAGQMRRRMHKHSDEFESLGQGKFRLRKKDE